MKQKDLEKLMEYLKKQFPGCIDNHWTYDLVKNLIDYAYRNHGHSKGSARAIVCSILPEVGIEEMEKYLPDFDEWEAEPCLNYEKLCFESINIDCVPVQVLFEYSREAANIESFLCGLSESDRPEGELIESIEFELFIFSMGDFKVECTLHGSESDYFIGDYIEVMHNAFEWLEQIPAEELSLIKETIEKNKEGK